MQSGLSSVGISKNQVQNVAHYQSQCGFLEEQMIGNNKTPLPTTIVPASIWTVTEDNLMASIISPAHYSISAVSVWPRPGKICTRTIVLIDLAACESIYIIKKIGKCNESENRCGTCDLLAWKINALAKLMDSR
jgi:hypothetical protein